MFENHFRGTLTSVTCKRTMQPDRDWRSRFAGLDGGIYLFPSESRPGQYQLSFCPEGDEYLRTSSCQVSVTDDRLTIDTRNTIYEFALTM